MILSFPNDINFSFLEDFNSILNTSSINNDISESLSLDEEEDDLDIYFPFTKGKLLANIIIKDLKFDVISRNQDRPRKDKEDEIRKKIKTSFHKNLTKIINKLLGSEGIKYKFEKLPQNFITDISRKTNHEVMDKTFEELFDYTNTKLINDKNRIINKKTETKEYLLDSFIVGEKNHLKNIETIKYLNSNSNCGIQIWNKIKKMKYIDLLKAYFRSKEFDESINILKLSKKENLNYIKKYCFYALTYIDYFQSYKPDNHTRTNPTFSQFSNGNNDFSLSSIHHEENSFSDDFISSLNSPMFDNSESPENHLLNVDNIDFHF